MCRFVLFLLAGLFLFSCTNRRVTPTRESRHAIDTIFQQKMLALQPDIDSLCVRLQDSLYPIAVDSILNERRKEMNMLVE